VLLIETSICLGNSENCGREETLREVIVVVDWRFCTSLDEIREIILTLAEMSSWISVSQSVHLGSDWIVVVSGLAVICGEMDVSVASCPVNKGNWRAGRSWVVDCFSLRYSSALEVDGGVVVVKEASIGSSNSLDLLAQIATREKFVFVKVIWCPSFVPECIEALAFLVDGIRVNVGQSGELRSDSIVFVGGLARLLGFRKLILADHPFFDGEISWDRDKGALEWLIILDVSQEQGAHREHCQDSSSSNSNSHQF
jgi:hypothetical protein